jgi:uncharacterized protein YcbK (DUF882 family)
VSAKLEAFIDSLGLKHFKGRELTEYWSRVRNGVQNSAPPEELWPNIVPTLRALDWIREKLGRPITITSSYRSPAYNRAVGGEKASYHMQFKAIDFQSPAGPAACLKVAREARKAGVITGGIGSYPTFTHIDCRGHNADW